MRLGEETRAALEVIPTGAIALDVALGIGGLPRGRVVEIYGPESSGKTTVALHAVANAQRAGGIVAFIDAEHALDPEYAKALGVDTDALLVSQPDSGEQALEIADMLIRSGALDLIVIDSVAALVPRAEIEGEMGDSHVGLQARLMSQALRKMTGALNGAGTTMIFINQLREKIGVMFGSPETTTGGRALKFYSSVRLDVRRIETLKDGQEMVGNRTRIKVVKNKVAPPFKQAEFDIMYGQGISREGGLIDVGVEAGLVRKAGAWYTYEGDQLGQGKENARSFLRDNPDLANELEKKILEKLGVGPQVDDRRAAGRVRSSRPGSTSDLPPTSPPVRSSPPRGPGGRTCLRTRRRSPVPARSARGSSAWLGTARGPAGARTRGGPRGGRPQDPARPAHRPGPQPLRAQRQAGRRRASPTRSPPGCSTGSRRSGWSTTRRSPGPGCSPGSPARAWPAGRWPRSCGARASTTRRPGSPSTRSTPTTRWRPPAPWCGASCAPSPGSTATWRYAGSPACWPARAIPPASASGWSARSSSGTATRSTTSASCPTERSPRDPSPFTGLHRPGRAVAGRRDDRAGESLLAAAERAVHDLAGRHGEQAWPLDLGGPTALFACDTPDADVPDWPSIGFRPLTRADLRDVVAWQAQPHVARWWQDEATSLDAAEAHYGPALDGDDPTRLWVLELNGRSVGFLQDYRIGDHPAYALLDRPTGRHRPRLPRGRPGLGRPRGRHPDAVGLRPRRRGARLPRGP